MTMKEAAQKTLDVQGACNLSGVAHSFVEIMLFLGNLGIAYRETHPIAKLWVDKMASLAGIQSFEWDLSGAYCEVERLAKEAL